MSAARVPGPGDWDDRRTARHRPAPRHPRGARRAGPQPVPGDVRGAVPHAGLRLRPAPPRPRPRSPATPTGSCTPATATPRCPRSRSACACSRAPRRPSPPRRACPRCSPRSPRWSSPARASSSARALFGSTVVIFEEILAKWGVRTDYVDGHELDQWEAALSTPADVVFFETPSNPMQDLVDIAAVSRLAHAAGATVIVDNVFATPVLSRPLEFGADVVVYSATKHIDGQGRVLGGAILGTDEYIHGPVQTLIRNTGPSLSAFNAWVLLKGLETLSLRVRHQTASALQVATWLEQQPGVSLVRYPYLTSHPQHELALAQQSGGGTVVTFNLAVPEGPTPDVAKKVTFGVPGRAADRRHLEQPRRRQVDGHAPRDDDAPQARSRGPCGGRHRGVDRPALRGARGPGRPDRRPRAGARHPGRLPPCATLAACGPAASTVVPARPAAARGGWLGVVVGVRRRPGRRASPAVLAGWATAAAVFVVWTWAAAHPMDPAQTAAHATREEPTRVGSHARRPRRGGRDARGGRRRARRRADRHAAADDRGARQSCWRRGPRSTRCSRCGTRGCTSSDGAGGIDFHTGRAAAVQRLRLRRRSPSA